MPDRNPMLLRLASRRRRAARFRGPGRLPALLEALFFLATMAAAPLLHQATCDGVCAAPKFQFLGGPPAGDVCCHPAKPAARGSSRSCGCLDDCCSMTAHFTPAPAVADMAPPTLLVVPAPGVRPESTPRAPTARLLPFPNGPPSAG